MKYNKSEDYVKESEELELKAKKNTQWREQMEMNMRIS